MTTELEQLKERYAGVVVTMAHLRRLGFCSSGVRAFFEARSDRLDYMAFLREGVSAEQLIDTGDGMAMRAVEIAAEKEAEE